MENSKHAMLIILVMGLMTLATRIIPVMIFGRGKRIPDYIMYLGKVVPYTAMGLLIVYCLKDVSVFEAPHALPEIIALSIVIGTYLWRRNTIFSVVVGTAMYMVMVQGIF